MARLLVHHPRCVHAWRVCVRVCGGCVCVRARACVRRFPHPPHILTLPELTPPLPHRYAVLDECTSAVSADGEQRLVQECVKAGITMLSIGHRPALRQYHRWGGWRAVGWGALGAVEWHGVELRGCEAPPSLPTPHPPHWTAPPYACAAWPCTLTATATTAWSSCPLPPPLHPPPPHTPHAHAQHGRAL